MDVFGIHSHVSYGYFCQISRWCIHLSRSLLLCNTQSLDSGVFNEHGLADTIYMYVVSPIRP